MVKKSKVRFCKEEDSIVGIRGVIPHFLLYKRVKKIFYLRLKLFFLNFLFPP